MGHDRPGAFPRHPSMGAAHRPDHGHGPLRPGDDAARRRRTGETRHATRAAAPASSKNTMKIKKEKGGDALFNARLQAIREKRERERGPFPLPGGHLEQFRAKLKADEDASEPFVAP